MQDRLPESLRLIDEQKHCFAPRENCKTCSKPWQKLASSPAFGYTKIF